MFSSLNHLFRLGKIVVYCFQLLKYLSNQLLKCTLVFSVALATPIKESIT